MRVADRAHARLHQVHALVGLPGGQHVLPDRVARRGVVEADRAVVRSGLQASAGTRAPRRRCCSRVHSAAAAALDGEVGDVDLAGHDEVVVAGQAEVAAAARQLDAVVGLGAVADQVAQAPDLVGAGRRRRRRARPRRPAGCRARPRAGRCASGCLLQCPGNGSQGFRWPIWALAAAAGDCRGGGRRRGGHAPAPPAQRHDRAGRRGRGIVLHGVPARPRGGLPQRPAPDRRGRAGGRHGHAGAARLAPAAARCSSGSRGGRSWAPRPPERASRCCSWSVDLPLSAWSHQRAVDVGLSTQDWPDWLADVAKSAAIGAGFAAVGGALALALVRRFPRNWWAPGAVVVVAFGVITIWLFPVVIDPLFNDFEKLPPGPTRSDVLELARKAGVDVGRGLPGRREPPHHGRQRLRQRARPLQAGGAVRQPDRRTSRATRCGWWWPTSSATRSTTTCCAAWPGWRWWRRPGTFLTQRLAEAFGAARRPGRPGRQARAGRAARDRARGRAGRRSAWARRSNVLSRQVEARADAFSLRLTNDPGSFVQFERRLAVRNISDPDPPRGLAAPVRHPPDDARADRHRRGLQREELGSG